MNSRNREDWIKNFIILNQGCHKQNVVETADKEGIASRKIVFDIIKKLTDEGIIRENKRKPNSKIIELFIDEKNPSINIPKKLNEIKEILLEATKEILIIYHKFEFKIHNYNKPYVNLLSQYFAILQNLLDWISECYLKKSILIWPKELKDSEILKKIIGQAILEIASMQTEFINSMLLVDEIVKAQTYLFVKPNQSARTYYLSNGVNKFINEVRGIANEEIYNLHIENL